MSFSDNKSGPISNIQKILRETRNAIYSSSQSKKARSANCFEFERVIDRATRNIANFSNFQSSLCRKLRTWQILTLRWYRYIESLNCRLTINQMDWITCNFWVFYFNLDPVLCALTTSTRKIYRCYVLSAHIIAQWNTSWDEKDIRQML